jgi:hypothetical protein
MNIHKLLGLDFEIRFLILFQFERVPKMGGANVDDGAELIGRLIVRGSYSTRQFISIIRVGKTLIGVRILLHGIWLTKG